MVTDANLMHLQGTLFVTNNSVLGSLLLVAWFTGGK